MQTDNGELGRELAAQLVKTTSPEAFWRRHARSGGVHPMMSKLNAELYRLAPVNLSAAERLADRIEQLAAFERGPVSMAFAQAGRACVMNHSGQYKEANSLFDRAAKTMLRARLSTESAIVRKHQVGVLILLGRYGEALEAGRFARRVLRRAEPVQLAQLETNIGNIYYRLDRYTQALNRYEQARKLFKATGDDGMMAFVDFASSNIFCEMDRPEEALALLEKAKVAWERSGNKLRAIQASSHIAYIQFLRGSFNKALTGYYQSRDGLAELGNPEMLAWCDQEIAEVLLALNAFVEAGEFAGSARAGFDKLGMPYESAQATLLEALCLMGLGQFTDARARLRRARAAFAKSGNKILTAQADLYLAELAIRIKRPREALRRASFSLRVFAGYRLATRSAYARVVKAHAAYELGEPAKASRMAKQALETVNGLFAPTVSYKSHHLQGLIDRNRKRHRAARENFLLAVEVIEQMRGGVATDEFKASFLRDKVALYEDAIAACLDEGSERMLERAFWIVESSKSRALADLLSRYMRGTQEAGQEANKTTKRLAKLIEELNWYSSQATSEEDTGDRRSALAAEKHRRAILGCERQVADLFRRLEAEGSAHSEIQRMRPASVADLSSTLEPGETAIEYFTTAGSVSAFIATCDKIRVVRNIAPISVIEQRLTALRFQLGKFNFGSKYVDANFNQLKRAADEHLVHLYDDLFGPLRSAIETTEGDGRVVFIPHGALHYVPFHALRRGSEYLVDRFQVSYSPSAAVLKLCRERAAGRTTVKNGGTLVALGVSDPALPGIAEEINALASSFPGAVTLTGNQATRENLLRFGPDARFVHLASHGHFRRDNPMFSFLKLADCRLDFYNLLDLRLRAELVTLSACDTGVNTIFPGDELHGLMRGFLYAGAPSVVASLWAVSDRSTSELMSRMYSSIRSGSTKRAALHDAQLAIRDDYGHPYYWAPFILMGDAR